MFRSIMARKYDLFLQYGTQRSVERPYGDAGDARDGGGAGRPGRSPEKDPVGKGGFTDRTESGGIGLKADGTLNIGPRPGVPPPKRPLTIIMADGEVRIISDLDWPGCDGA
jgi:hypothetical protein